MKTNFIPVIFILLGTLFLASCGGTKPRITGITSGPADLVIPQKVPEGETQRYGLGFPFQVGPKTAGLLLNLRMEGMGIGDFENGSDVLLFNDIASINVNPPAPVTRNEKYRDPATGEKRILVKYPGKGGFVPFGALRANGSLHPHAGSGFSICAVIDRELTETGAYKVDTIHLLHLELRQLAFDGITFRVGRNKLYRTDQPLWIGDSGWKLRREGFAMAIPDGDDLLMAGIASREKDAYGVVRWQSMDGIWQPVSFMPIAEISSGMEPSLTRDADGTLLFTIRIGDRKTPEAYSIRVWRSKDIGANWKRIIDIPDMRDAGPVSIGRATGGTPFIVGNPVQEDRSRNFRAVLKLWPLNSDRSSVELPLMVRDGPDEFGPVPTRWVIDHPTSAVLRLADGKWHSVLIYRVMESGSSIKDATPHVKNGLYLEEIHSQGSPIPAWQFAE